MKLLVIGNGAREHALTWKIKQSSRVKEIYAVPGNAGTASFAHNINLSSTDIPSIVKKAVELQIDLVVVGPEAPLAAGIVDKLQAEGIAVFGPTQAAAQLESSKVFSRELMQKHGIPCAAGNHFSDYNKAKAYLENCSIPVVVKADGLAAGKGVIIANSMEDAVKALDSIMQTREFGAAGDKVIIEECLFGKEVSLLAFTDGETAIPMVPACDYKRVFDDDKGPNTGGMGSYSPPGFFGADLTQQILNTVIQPTIDAMRKNGTPYKGVLYTGLIMTAKGPMVLEYNARFGDPETQAILPRLKTDIVDIMLAVVKGNLKTMDIQWSTDPCVGVVMASGGYPGKYPTAFPITVSDKIDKDISVFYAGAKMLDDGQIVTDGGRVLTVTATGKTMKEARDKVYRNIVHINFKDCHYRKDIGAREVN
ncbi:MAG: phosphoribosylamine--glycine ligase [Dehalococcoidia bacterium]|nr:MAG: phosphoribosylamine--glycine ligase [Dehalococcoidia bacterium]